MRNLAICAGAILYALLPSTAAAADDEPLGTVSGVALDDQRAPVVGVKVTARLVDEGPEIRAIRYVETDEQGRFTIDRLKWGDYEIYTRKDSAGYANSGSNLYSDASMIPKATLSPKTPSATVIVNLGPRAGIIKGTVTDAASGQPVNAQAQLWRIAEPDRRLGKSLPSTYQLLVPPGVPTGMEVDAEGYESWYYPGGAVTEGSGQTVVVNIKLVPVVKSP